MSGCLADNKVEVNIYNGTNASPGTNASSVTNLSPGANASPADATFAPILPGTHMERMEYGGYSREYLVHVPPSYDGSKPYPLVIVMHGHGGTAAGMEKMTGFDSLADSEGFIVVYPQGAGIPGATNVNDTPAWRVSSSCCRYAVDHDVDDVGFLGAMLDRIEGEINADKDRVYAAGFSNGAGMAYTLGCVMADRFAAIAPVEGAMETDQALNIKCTPSGPVSVVAILGTNDPKVPYDGGIFPDSVPSLVPSVRSEIDFWSAFDGCTMAANATEARDVTSETHTECKNGTGVLQYTIEGGTHMWSGPKTQNPANKEISATDVIWEFFDAHPRS
ncbi:MAG TPA: PHB depolymerase family esterase [Candidatus Bilamarchaeum sp.]|nr:PHB depolymerase family esterase [Candidatus Bilamarchaeum sp.]